MEKKRLICVVFLIALLSACNFDKNQIVAFQDKNADSLFVEREAIKRDLIPGYALDSFSKKLYPFPLIDSLLIYSSQNLRIFAMENLYEYFDIVYCLIYRKNDLRYEKVFRVNNKAIDSSYNAVYKDFVSFLIGLNNSSIISSEQLDSLSILLFCNKLNYLKTSKYHSNIGMFAIYRKTYLKARNIRTISDYKQQKGFINRNGHESVLLFQKGMSPNYYYSNREFQSAMRRVLSNLIIFNDKLCKMPEIFKLKCSVVDSFLITIDSTFYLNGGKVIIVQPEMNFYQIVKENQMYKIVNYHEFGEKNGFNRFRTNIIF